MKVIQKVACKFGRDDVRTVRFSAGPKRVRITCKGKPPLVVMATNDGAFTVMTRVGAKKKRVMLAEAPTAEAAYKKGVRAVWRGR